MFCCKGSGESFYYKVMHNESEQKVRERHRMIYADTDGSPLIRAIREISSCNCLLNFLVNDFPDGEM